MRRVDKLTTVAELQDAHTEDYLRANRLNLRSQRELKGGRSPRILIGVQPEQRNNTQNLLVTFDRATQPTDTRDKIVSKG